MERMSVDFMTRCKQNIPTDNVHCTCWSADDLISVSLFACWDIAMCKLRPFNHERSRWMPRINFQFSRQPTWTYFRGSMKKHKSRQSHFCDPSLKITASNYLYEKINGAVIYTFSSTAKKLFLCKWRILLSQEVNWLTKTFKNTFIILQNM